MADCNSSLLALLQSSTFNTAPGDPRQYTCEINKKKHSYLLVQTFAKLESGEDSSLGWLIVDFEKKELKDISHDPSNPLYLDFDPALLKSLRKNCFPLDF